PLRRAVLERLPEVRCISVAFVGVDHVDLDYCTEHGIVVSNCPGYSQEAVAELVFGLALALYRDIPVADDRVREGGTAAGLSGREISGKTFGIIGAGAIGRRVAQIARALGATVVAWNRTPRTVEGIEFLPLDEVLQRADILSVHVASTPQTHHLIGAEQLALLKPSAILINTARGPVVDSAALAEALTTGTLAGAGLDVFDTEPPLDQSEPLLTAPHTVLTPHLGFATHEALETRAHLVFENIAAYVAGAPVHTVC
ncbi:MAG: D-2-hydroxyacid dehydrogenase family protein, partial [Microbacteriaceae bacterium]|nr:D-2-hydroxyacid dehydrogenase family protein [Microbacteriaceae bacterium]